MQRGAFSFGVIRSAIVRSIRIWLPLSVVVTVLCGLVYAEVQGSLRQAANDPQIQMAEDTAASLAAGTAATSLISGSTVDIASSLSPFLIVYDRENAVITSSATFHGTIPGIPAGVLISARRNGEDRVTWEPSPGVRIAAVVVAYGNGAVLAGRSLREVEQRESNALNVAVAGWVAAEAAVGATVLVIEIAVGRRRVSHIGSS